MRRDCIATHLFVCAGNLCESLAFFCKIRYNFFMYYLIELLASFLAVTVVLTLHEFAHAYVAYKCGDPTPKFNKRLTLNPLAHFDILGLVLFAFAGFGWAKPVPINPMNFNHYKRGLTLTAVAGVAMNYITAFLFCPLFYLVTYYVNIPFAALQNLLELFTLYLFLYSVSFCVFNLIPLPPLDGWRVVQALNKRRGRVYRFFERYGNIILIVLIAFHFLTEISLQYEVLRLAGNIFWYADILGHIMRYVVWAFKWPITALWGLVF